MSRSADDADIGESEPYGLDGRLWAADIQRTDKDSDDTPHQIDTFAAYYYAGGIRFRQDSRTSVDNGVGVDRSRLWLNDPGNFTGYSQVLEEYEGATVAIPRENASFLRSPAFRQALQSLQRANNTIIRLIPIKAWRRR